MKRGRGKYEKSDFAPRLADKLIAQLKERPVAKTWERPWPKANLLAPTTPTTRGSG
jgi:antirestriction protein ArdC